MSNNGILITMLRWNRRPFKNGAGNSKAMINTVNRTERICMMGALIMTVTKMAELGGALAVNVVRWEPFEMRGRRTH